MAGAGNDALIAALMAVPLIGEAERGEGFRRLFHQTSLGGHAENESAVEHQPAPPVAASRRSV
jgi:hypothetical protein